MAVAACPDAHPVYVTRTFDVAHSAFSSHAFRYHQVAMSVPLFISIADVAELPNAGIKAVPARIQVTTNESPAPRIVCKPSKNVCTGRRIQRMPFSNKANAR